MFNVFFVQSLLSVFASVQRIVLVLHNKISFIRVSANNPYLKIVTMCNSLRRLLIVQVHIS